MRTQMNGYVVADEDAELYRWCGYTVISPQDVRQAIADNPAGETLTFEVNSPGGNMFAGYEIYSVLKGAAVSTEAEIQSLSGSAMSVGMLGVDVIKASPVAQTMIHLPALSTSGDAVEHGRSLQALKSFTESVLNVYELRCKGKKTRAELAAMMEAETWMTAQDALATGFVDEVLYDDDGIIAAQVVMCVGNGIRALVSTGGLPDAAELRARKAATEDGAITQKNNDKAALALQRARLNLLKNI